MGQARGVRQYRAMTLAELARLLRDTARPEWWRLVAEFLEEDRREPTDTHCNYWPLSLLTPATSDGTSFSARWPNTSPPETAAGRHHGVSHDDCDVSGFLSIFRPLASTRSFTPQPPFDVGASSSRPMSWRSRDRA
jgi:hypothetical protein